MSNLTKLQAIRDRLKKDNGWSTDEAVNHISEVLTKSPLTVYGWLEKRQIKPIPDNTLELLTLKLSKD